MFGRICCQIRYGRQRERDEQKGTHFQACDQSSSRSSCTIYWEEKSWQRVYLGRWNPEFCFRCDKTRICNNSMVAGPTKWPKVHKALNQWDLYMVRTQKALTVTSIVNITIHVIHYLHQLKSLLKGSPSLLWPHFPSVTDTNSVGCSL